MGNSGLTDQFPQLRNKPWGSEKRCPQHLGFAGLGFCSGDTTAGPAEPDCGAGPGRCGRDTESEEQMVRQMEVVHGDHSSKAPMVMGAKGGLRNKERGTL